MKLLSDDELAKAVIDGRKRLAQVGYTMPRVGGTDSIEGRGEEEKYVKKQRERSEFFEDKDIKKLRDILKSHGRNSYSNITANIPILKKLSECYEAGFKCYYCGKTMEISLGSPDSFTLDHGTPKTYGGDSEYDNIYFVCYGCNVLKSCIQKDNFVKIVSAIKEVYGNSFFEEIKKERTEPALKNRMGVYAHRPRKEIDIDSVIKNYNSGKTFKNIASELNVSTVTLWNRLKEAGVISHHKLRKLE